MVTLRLLHNGRIAACVLALLLVRHSSGATVSSETLTAWHGYVQQSTDDLTRQLGDPDRFLWIDRQRVQKQKTRAGGIVAIPAKQGAVVTIPSGLVHHWLGAVFVPDVRALDVLAALQDYDSYTKLYSSAVIDSKLLSRTRNQFDYRLKFVQKGFGVKAGLLGEFRSTYVRLTPAMGYSITEATQLDELVDAGEAQERVLPLTASHGYVEKMFTIVRYRESDGGVYLEIDALTLSRDIPVSVRWLIAPIVRKFSGQVMTTTLENLKTGLQQTRSFESASTR